MKKSKPSLPFIFLLFNEALSAPNLGLRQRLHLYRVLFALWFKDKFFKAKNGQNISQKMFGFTVHAYDYGTLLYLVREVFVAQEYYFETDKESLRIMDCGANIGMATLYFKLLYPRARIYSFEPNPTAYALLKKNVEANGLEDVTVYNFGLAEEHGSLEFFTNSDNGSLMGSFNKERGGGKSIIVKTFPLSDMMDADESLDLIKIDVEGAEWLIFRDLIKADAISRSDRYIIEYHHLIDKQSERMSDFLALLEDNGFECRVSAFHDREKDFQDVLIYAARKADKQDKKPLRKQEKNTSVRDGATVSAT